MSFELARKIADTVLYEGYLLYPYRASAIKNRFRWQFGVVAPAAWSGDPSFMQTECLIEPHAALSLDVTVRFLQVQPDDQGLEQSVELCAVEADRLEPFEFAPVRGVVRVSLGRVEERWKLRVRIENTSAAHPVDRPDAMRHSLVGTHTLLRIRGGAFVSALETGGCENVHTWPVLVGKPGSRDVVLSAPIILQDYPAVAPESPGDFFDATEIDELLTLRVMTLTDHEKQEVTDERARRIIERCDAMPPEIFEKLHGAARPIGEEFFNPAGEPESIEIGERRVAPGERVRLAPNRRADSMDMFLRGRTARVEAVHRDVEDRAYVAVSVEDDPGAEIYPRFYYFYPDEIELIEKES